MFLKAHQPRKLRYEKSVHVVLPVDHELRERPERLLLLVQVHEEQRRYLRHALAVADLAVVHAVGGQDVEQVLLAVVVPLAEHRVVAVGAVHVQVDLTNVGGVKPGQLLHFLILALLDNNYCTRRRQLFHLTVSPVLA